MKNRITVSIILLMVLVYLTGCRDYNETDFVVNCPNSESIDPFFLLPTSKDVIPYDLNITRMVFEDTNGQEVYFQSNQNFLAVNNFFDFNQYPCEEDPNQFLSYNIFREIRVIEFYNQNLNFSVGLTLQVEIMVPPEGKSGITVYDNLNISRFYNGNIYLDIVIDPRTSNKNITTPYLQTAELWGQTYTDVYGFSSLPSYSPNVYYTKSDGIIGLLSGDGVIDLKFLRVE